MSETYARQMPYDLNAEAAVLSAMMLDSYAIARAIEMLTEEYFYRNSHKIIYRTIVDLFDNNVETDIITITNELKTNKVLEKAGGEEYLIELSDMVLSSANLEYHAKIVEEKALLRQLILTSNQIIDACYNAEEPVKDVIDKAEQMIFQVAKSPVHKAVKSVKEIIDYTMKNLEDAASSKKIANVVPTGFVDLDRVIGGFRPGQLIVLAARPAMGKSAFALNIAFNAAVNHYKSVCIFTMEMESEELVLRLFSAQAEVNMDYLIRGQSLDEKKILRITGVADVLRERKIFIDDTGSNTILDIRAKARRLKAEVDDLDLIIIDYLQLMTAKKAKENRQQEISEISRNLKILAKELSLPIIALSQLNRGLESRDDKRPRLSDLRESGAIEQDADIVMFIYREEAYNKETEFPNNAEIIIGKNRHGETRNVNLYFQKKFTKFSNATSYQFEDEKK
jgi:replicative DNA helicase